jgi:putative lipoprotein
MIADRLPAGLQRHRRSVPGVALALLLVVRAAPVAGRDLWLGPDKALHFGVSCGLAGVGFAVAAPLRRAPVARVGTVATLVMAAGIAKEMHDRTSGGDPSLRDLTWDAVGTATGLLVGWLVDRYLPAGRGGR